MTVLRLMRVLTRIRFDLSNEAQMQEQLAAALSEAGFTFSREKALGPRDRVDFLCGDVAIELKIKGHAKSVHRQLCRYCKSPAVRALILVTGRTMSMPTFIEDKPVYVFPVARSLL